MKQDGNKKGQNYHCEILQDVEENADLVKVIVRMKIKADLVKVKMWSNQARVSMILNSSSGIRAWIQQYLQHEHYALWEVIEFRDSYEALDDVVARGSATEGTGKKKGRTVALTTKDMQKRKNDTCGGNEATKKTKKNPLKQQYGNFKAEGSETLEQAFNSLQAIVSRIEFMDIEIKQDDLNQKFLTSLAPEWLMHTIL
nr:hypothetical protein [Tanacetum cinerariifolium]